MQNYLVIIEDRIICEGRIIVSANNAAEAALIARLDAQDDLIPMSPMENGSECPRIYRIADEYDRKDVARLGDGVGGSSNTDCLTNHLDEILAIEGIEEYEFDDDLFCF